MHTVFADCDRHGWTYNRHAQNFNPHSPRRLWLITCFSPLIYAEFQSTQSSQTVTVWGSSFLHVLLFQSTQSSQTVTRECQEVVCGSRYFNPHSPRRLWLLSLATSVAGLPISIHTVLADCDLWKVLAGRRTMDFNPHSPRRLWQNSKSPPSRYKYFNPHSPRRLWQMSTRI